ncbi:hypothetical protein SEA_JUSTBECAUSE_233 [Streptomyces phage JustBecause]|jgi:hypothetical protein|nr:hypothetical protein SEA_JUSTBECAUSE_233 [Streptomyces phage JustBecause]
MLTESSWPQPHENVRGVDRTRDDLLSLEGPAVRRRAVILTIAYQLWQATLRGAHTEQGRAAYDRMDNPRMGDLVAELGTARRPRCETQDEKNSMVEGFGIFLGEREEWTCSHEEWRADVERSRQEGEAYTLEDRATVKAMYVQYGPAAQDVCRWVNCSVMALPTGMLYHTVDQNP